MKTIKISEELAGKIGAFLDNLSEVMPEAAILSVQWEEELKQNEIKCEFCGQETDACDKSDDE